MQKRTLKKLALAFFLAGGLVTGLGGVAFAGGDARGFGGPGTFEKLENMTEAERLEFLENKLDQRVERMTEHLELTKDQQVKVRQILADAQTQLLEIYDKNKDAADKTVARAEAKAVRKQSMQDVRDILTDAQRAKMEEHRKERGKGHKGEMKGKMLDRLDEKLDLSDAQRAKVEKILDASHKQLEKNRAEGGGREGAKAIMKASADDINKVLTKEQQVKFAELQKKMQERRAKHGERGRRGEQTGAF